MPVEELLDVSLPLETAGGAARPHAAVAGQRGNGPGPGLRPGVLEDALHALLAGQAAHFLRPIRIGIVDPVVRTQLTGLLQLGIRARRRDDTGAEQLRNLDADR